MQTRGFKTAVHKHKVHYLQSLWFWQERRTRGIKKMISLILLNWFWLILYLLNSPLWVCSEAAAVVTDVEASHYKSILPFSCGVKKKKKAYWRKNLILSKSVFFAFNVRQYVNFPNNSSGNKAAQQCSLAFSYFFYSNNELSSACTYRLCPAVVSKQTKTFFLITYPQIPDRELRNTVRM